jgi:hypothetical protein
MISIYKASWCHAKNTLLFSLLSSPSSSSKFTDQQSVSPPQWRLSTLVQPLSTSSNNTICLYRYIRHICTEVHYSKGKGKAVPLQAWSGPEVSRELRFPDFITTAQNGGKVVSLMHRPPLPPGNTLGTHFC